MTRLSWASKCQIRVFFGHFQAYNLWILQAGGHENTVFGRQGDTIVYSCTLYGRPWIAAEDTVELWGATKVCFSIIALLRRQEIFFYQWVTFLAVTSNEIRKM